MSLLEIKNLKARVEDKDILNGITLTVKPGEVHAIMGPNGSGKSTLASVLAGRDEYEVTGGEVLFNGKESKAMADQMFRRTGGGANGDIGIALAEVRHLMGCHQFQLKIRV